MTSDAALLRVECILLDYRSGVMSHARALELLTAPPAAPAAGVTAEQVLKALRLRIERGSGVLIDKTTMFAWIDQALASAAKKETKE